MIASLGTALTVLIWVGVVLGSILCLTYLAAWAIAGFLVLREWWENR